MCIYSYSNMNWGIFFFVFRCLPICFWRAKITMAPVITSSIKPHERNYCAQVINRQQLEGFDFLLMVLFTSLFLFCFVFFCKWFQLFKQFKLTMEPVLCNYRNEITGRGGERGKKKEKKALRLNNKERKNMEMRWYNHNVDLHSQ